MTILRRCLRIISVVFCAVFLTGTALSPCVPMRVSAAPLDLGQTVSAVPYIARAAWGELHGILEYAVGIDPCRNKTVQEAGQNTKNNVAISLIRLNRMVRGVYAFRYAFVPTEDNPAVSELCVYVKRLAKSREECIRTGILCDGARRVVSTADGTGAMGIGYKYNYAFDTFSAEPDPWQRNFGFCQLYDHAAFLIGDRYETIRVLFRYNGKDWMAQMWKGIYSWNMLGGEIGLYNKPIDRKAAFYDCASDPERLPMCFCLKSGDETVVQTDRTLSWWQTTFTVHEPAEPSSLTMCFSIDFPNAQMLRAFADSLSQTAPQVRVQRTGLRLDCCWPAA